MTRNYLKHHLLLLLIATALASIFPYYLDIHPRLRMNFDSAFQGILACLPIILLTALAHTLMLLILGQRYLQKIEIQIKQVKESSILEKLGFSLGSSAAEELLLRCSIFSFLLIKSVPLAFVVNALLSFLAKNNLRKTYLLGIAYSVEGSLLAYLYFNRQSYFSLFIAHFLCAMFWQIFMKTNWFYTSLNYIVTIRSKLPFLRTKKLA